jgi:hypothetical protein
VWLVLAVLVVVIGVTEYRDRRGATSGDETDPRQLLSVPLEQLGALEIAERGRLHRFERDPTGTWIYHGVHTAATAEHTHAADPVLAERITGALTAFGRARIERRFALDRGADAYGVTTPEILVLVYRARERQPVAQYAVGHVAPDTTSRYVTHVGSPEVVTIPGYQIDNLLALVQAAGERGGQGMAGQ